MKLYYPKSHYNKDYRGMVFPLLKPFIKGDNFTDTQRIKLYGVSEKDFEFTELIEDADVIILTMAWNYYIKTKQEKFAFAFVSKCERLNKKVIALNTGDFGVRIPYYQNLIVLRPGGYKSKFTMNEYTLPAFVSDPLKKYFNTDKIFQRPYHSTAIIGFCGQANISRINGSKELLKTLLRNTKFYLRYSRAEPQQLLSTSFLRAWVLIVLQKSRGVEVKFILRKKYRAGVTGNKDKHKTTLEFYNNLKESDYVVCVRGAGNFSVRFYEAMAMGRIPIFINTDCSLPMDSIIDWKKHVVWVEYKERSQVAKKVKQFHDRLTEVEFLALQHANRKLWEERLTLRGFYQNFIQSI